MTEKNEDIQLTDDSIALQVRFLNVLLAKLQLKNDAALSRAMDVAPPVISKFRHGKLPFSAPYVIKAHELTGMSVADIKVMLGQKTVQEVLAEKALAEAAAKAVA